MSEYISREAALAALHNRAFDKADTGGEYRALVWAARQIKSLPAANVRPVVRGKWEDVHIDRPEIADLEVASMFCPHCNRWHNEVYQYGNPIEFANFCPHCGADMREEIDHD